MADPDDIDFDAYMRDRGVPKIDRPAAEKSRAGLPEGASEAELQAAIAGLQRALKGARILRAQAEQALAVARGDRDQAREALAAMQDERDRAREALAVAQDERERAREGLAAAQRERDEARRALAAAEGQRDALGKERRALERRVAAAAPAVAPPQAAEPRLTLREALLERGVEDEDESVELLLALLDADRGAVLDGLEVAAALRGRWQAHVALVCERAECQPEGARAVVLRVEPERCEVCGGSDIKVAFALLLRASRVAGVTRLVIVGGSPPYHTQLKELSRGTDLKLDLVSGRSKLGKRRARTEAERVVIWGATILDHGTSAAYEHLGDRLIRVPHRGISRMLREVAAALG